MPATEATIAAAGGGDPCLCGPDTALF